MVKSCDSSKISPVATEVALGEGTSAEVALPLCCRRWAKNRVNSPKHPGDFGKSPVESLDTGLLDCTISFCVCKRCEAGTHTHIGTYSECCPEGGKQLGELSGNACSEEAILEVDLQEKRQGGLRSQHASRLPPGTHFQRARAPRVLSSLAPGELSTWDKGQGHLRPSAWWLTSHHSASCELCVPHWPPALQRAEGSGQLGRVPVLQVRRR